MKKVFITLESFSKHMTSETHQLQQGLKNAGWEICGPGLKHDTTDCSTIVEHEKPDVCLIQDKREWDERSFGGGKYKLKNIDHIGCVKGTILKDAQWAEREWYGEIGIDFFVTYYKDAASIANVPQHKCIRTYHAINKWEVPMKGHCGGAVLSGALSDIYYPLRTRLAENGYWFVLPHPGYGEFGNQSFRYLEELSKYKVSICTASVYDYLLRKIIESVACGCIVVTNLVEEVPYIDEYLVRVSNDISNKQMQLVVDEAVRGWRKDIALEAAEITKERYDFRTVYKQLDGDIESWLLANDRR